MDFGKIAGTVVATANTTGVEGQTFRIVELCDHAETTKNKYLIALDTLGAGPGEFVLVAQGSSARQTSWSDKKAVDAVIVGIIDLVEEKDRIVYRK